MDRRAWQATAHYRKAKYFILYDEESIDKEPVQFSCSVMSYSLQPCGLQHTRPPCLSPTPGVYSNSCPSGRWCHPTISSSVIPSPPAFNLPQHQGLFQWVGSSYQVAKVLELQLQHQTFQHSGLISFRIDWLDLLAAQGTFKRLLQNHNSKSIGSLGLSFLYDPTLLSIHDY